MIFKILVISIVFIVIKNFLKFYLSISAGNSSKAQTRYHQQNSSSRSNRDTFEADYKVIDK